VNKKVIVYCFAYIVSLLCGMVSQTVVCISLLVCQPFVSAALIKTENMKEDKN
jgi:hypothetical protein